MVSSAQNRSTSSEICPENDHKIGRFLPFVFRRSLTRKFPGNSREIGRFFRKFVPNNPPKFDFFSATYQKPCMSSLFSNEHLALQFLVPQTICKSHVSRLIVVCSIESVLFFINIHIFNYPDPRLSGLFRLVPTSLDN